MAVERVILSGGAGNIAYSLVFMIARGDLLGEDTEIVLCLYDLPQTKEVMEGVKAELEDSCFPLLKEIKVSTDPEEAFKDCTIALLVGARPRSPGMERKDLLKANSDIFKNQAKYLDKHANNNVKILVVGNPANTNALVLANSLTRIQRRQITALTMLDHNRAKSAVSLKIGISIDKIRNPIIWGNHSTTQLPDLNSAQYSTKEDDKWESLKPLINDDHWLNSVFIDRIQKRGGEVLSLRKLSSAGSAAKAICDHMRKWVRGTLPGEIISMAVCSNNNPYSIPEGLIFSFPVICVDGNWIIQSNHMPDSELFKDRLNLTIDELISERESLI